jgi:hypothetical protein
MMESVQEEDPDWDTLEADDLEALLADEPDVIDALDKPPCPVCASSLWELDPEFSAWICDECGLWRDAEPDPDDLLDP